mgnify:FL=1
MQETNTKAEDEEPSVEAMDALIGATPLVGLERIGAGGPPIYVKLENNNPSGSIRDRYLAEILLRASEAGQLLEGDTVAIAGIDDCSVATAFLASQLDIEVEIFASRATSRRLLPLIERYGASVRWLPEETSRSEAVEEAAEWARHHPRRMFVNGYRREAVREAYDIIADELLEALGDRPLGAFITSVTTGGAYRQVTGELRETHPEMVVGGAVLAQRSFPSLEDDAKRNILEDIDIEKAWEMRDRIARKEGLLVGPKGAAAVTLALRLQTEVQSQAALVALNPDAGQRYLGWEDDTKFELERGP